VNGDVLAVVSLAVSALIALGVYFNTRRANRNAEKKQSSDEQQAEFGANLELNRYIDGRVKELLDERMRPVQEELAAEKAERAKSTRAMTRILRALAAQWPVDAPGPVLDPEDIAAVEETIPEQWLPRQHL
jgi:hypothetical protein